MDNNRVRARKVRPREDHNHFLGGLLHNDPMRANDNFAQVLQAAGLFCDSDRPNEGYRLKPRLESRQEEVGAPAGGGRGAAQQNVLQAVGLFCDDNKPDGVYRLKPRLESRQEEVGAPAGGGRGAAQQNDHVPGQGQGRLHPRLTSLFSVCESQIGESINALMVSVLSSSQYSTREEAVMELGRSTLLYVILIHALASEDIIISSLLLRVGDNLSVFNSRRCSTYLCDLLNTEFTFSQELCQSATRFAKKMQGILEVPQVIINFLQSHLQAPAEVVMEN